MSFDIKSLIFIVDSIENYIPQIVKKVLPENICLIATSNENLEAAVKIGKDIKQELQRIEIKYDLIQSEENIRYLHYLQRLLIRLKTNGFAESQIGVGLTATREITIAITGIFAGLFGLRLFYYIPPEHEGSEGKVLVLADPDDIWGFIEFRNGISSFNSFDYVHSMEIFNNLLGKATSIKSKRMMEVLTLLSDAYLKWDSFRYEEAWRKISQCVTKLQECLLECEEEGKEFMESLKNNLNFLNVVRDGDKSSLLKTVDLWLNGMRRYYEKKCDDAIIRFYRALELCAQHRLIAKYNVDTSRFSETCNNIPTDKLSKFLETIKVNSPPENVGLFHAIILLKIMEDPFAMKIPEKAMFKLMSSRNSCILVHGFNVIADQTILEFAKEVEAILEILFELESINYSDVKTQATLIALERESLSRIIFV
jgi:CRISPR-associated protein (TIGR02710 family)